MNDRRQDDSGMIPATRLKARLRQLRRIEPPDGLKDKLLAAVPVAATRQTDETMGPHRPGVLRYVGLAAAIVIVASSVAFRCFAPWIGTPRFVADINERSSTASVVDHNSSLPRDSNIYDNNAIP